LSSRPERSVVERSAVSLLGFACTEHIPTVPLILFILLLRPQTAASAGMDPAETGIVCS
jgi:hypothetical protein